MSFFDGKVNSLVEQVHVCARLRAFVFACVCVCVRLRAFVWVCMGLRAFARLRARVACVLRVSWVPFEPSVSPTRGSPGGELTD